MELINRLSALWSRLLKKDKIKLSEDNQNSNSTAGYWLSCVELAEKIAEDQRNLFCLEEKIKARQAYDMMKIINSEIDAENTKHYCHLCGAEANNYIKTFSNGIKTSSEWLCDSCLHSGIGGYKNAKLD